MTQPQNPSSTSDNMPAGTSTPSPATPGDRLPRATSSDSNAADGAREPSTAEKNAQGSAPVTMKVFRDNVESAKGVVLALVSDPTIMAVAISGTADGILRNHVIADLPTCPVSIITFLHPADSREAEPVKAYASKCVQEKKLLMEPITHCSRFNALSYEGVPLLMPYLTPNACLFVQIEYKDLTRDDVIAALAYLNAEAEKRDALIVVYLLHTKKQDVTWLGQHCNVFVAVGKCEPGPGAQAALVLINETLAGWHLQGIGRVMVEAKLVSGGDWTYRREPFIAERAIIRLAWYLYAEGVTIEKIAQIIGIHKSNVSRGFDALLIPPKNAVGLAPPKDFRKRWAHRYRLDDVSLSKMSGAAIGDSGAGESATTPVTPKSDGADHAANGASATNPAHTASPKSKQ